MNVNQIHAEELAESRRRREAAQSATDDGMPMAPESDEQDVEVVPYRKAEARDQVSEEMARCGIRPHVILTVDENRDDIASPGIAGKRGTGKAPVPAGPEGRRGIVPTACTLTANKFFRPQPQLRSLEVC